MSGPSTITCVRCSRGNDPSHRACQGCGLPLGSAVPDTVAGMDALGPYEAPEPIDPDVRSALRDLVVRSGFDAAPCGHGYRLVLPMQPDRRQVVYLGQSGTDGEGRAILTLISVCGPVRDRDARALLKLNARLVEGHYAIKTLRGEEYFVVVHNLVAAASARLDARGLVRRIADAADSLEDRLSQGRDLY